MQHAPDHLSQLDQVKLAVEVNEEGMPRRGGQGKGPSSAAGGGLCRVPGLLHRQEMYKHLQARSAASCRAPGVVVGAARQGALYVFTCASRPDFPDAVGPTISSACPGRKDTC